MVVLDGVLYGDGVGEIEENLLGMLYGGMPNLIRVILIFNMRIQFRQELMFFHFQQWQMI